MGLNNEFAHATPQRRNWLVIDLETVPAPDCAEYLDANIEAPSNYRDPEKIKSYIEQRRQQQLNAAGLDLDLCEVVAVAMGTPDFESVVTRAEVDERALIVTLWEHVIETRRSYGVILGFNVLNFDLLVLLRRSLYLGLQTPRLQVDRYRHDGIVDVAEVLSFGRREHLRSLHFYCQRFGIPHSDAVTGAQIAGLVAAGDWDRVAEHCLDDMRGARDLAIRANLIARPPVPVVDDLDAI